MMYKSTGIILRRHDYGEADRIFTIITPAGKVSAIAKSVRRIRAKLASHLDVFAEIDLMLAIGKRLDVVTSARITRHYRLAEDYERMWRGFLFLEMVDKLSGEQDTAEIYHCLCEGLELLEKIPPATAELAFKLRLLDVLGRTPQLERTVDTQETAQANRAYGFDYALGGIRTSPVDGGELTPEALKLWRLCLRMSQQQIGKVEQTELVARASLPVCDRFYAYLFDVRFKAAEIKTEK